jgi:hypothetical protein
VEEKVLKLEAKKCAERSRLPEVRVNLSQLKLTLIAKKEAIKESLKLTQ